MNRDYLKEEIVRAYEEKGVLMKCIEAALKSGIIAAPEIPTLARMLEALNATIKWREQDLAALLEKNDNK